MVEKRKAKVAARVVVAALATVGIAFAAVCRMCAPSSEEVGFARDMVSLDSAIGQATEAFADDQGYVSPENQRQAVEVVRAYADQNPDGTVSSYVDDGDSITLVLENGVHYVYVPSVEGELGGAGDTASVATYEPYESVFGNDGQPTGLVDQAKKIADGRGITDGDATSHSGDSAVSVEALKTAFGKNELVLWYGHACTSSLDGTLLGTGTTAVDAIDKHDEGHPLKWIVDRINWRLALREGGVSESDYQNYAMWMALNEMYSDDFLEGRFVVFARSDGDNRIAVTPEFFSHYYDEGALSGSSFYFGACQVMTNPDSLAKTLTDLGAENVAGFTGSVSVGYESSVRAALADALASKNSSFADAACEALAHCDAADPNNAGTRFSLVSTDERAQHAWEDALGRSGNEDDASEASASADGAAAETASEGKSSEVAQENVQENPSGQVESLGASDEPAPDAEGSAVESWRRKQAGWPTWYEGSATFVSGERSISSLNVRDYISDARIDGDTLVVEGALVSGTSEEELGSKNPSSNPAAVDDPQTYRFRLTDATVVTRMGQTWNADQFKANFGDGRTLAPGWTFCVDTDGNLLELKLHS